MIISKKVNIRNKQSQGRELQSDDSLKLGKKTTSLGGKIDVDLQGIEIPAPSLPPLLSPSYLIRGPVKTIWPSRHG